MEDYKKYLQSDYWEKRRVAFKKKTYNRCFICHSKNNLHVHHKRYKRKGKSILYKEKNTDLRLLCADCHLKIHKYFLEEVFAKNMIKRRKLRDMFKKLK